MSQNNVTIPFPLNVHNLVNPPHMGSGIVINLNLLNHTHFSIQEWEKTPQPSFTLQITNPKSLGLNSQESNMNKFMHNVILACNLVLKRSAFSRSISNTDPPTIHRKKNQTSVKSINTPTGTQISVLDKLTFTENVCIASSYKEELDENRVRQILRKINTLDDKVNDSNLKIQNLQKSLDYYYLGTTSLDRLSIFKELFCSFELATNCDGQNRSGYQFDQKAASISGTEQSIICDLRNFYSRTKHIDKNPQDEQKYKKGVDELGQKITHLHKIAQSIIVHRLDQIL